jgi:DNA polymerase-1
MPAVSLDVLRKLAGKNLDAADERERTYGDAYAHFDDGRAACEAIDALCRVSAINMMLNTFIEPLQRQADPRGRVHCSLGLNTETGRLSSRKPNLQNQPALEKDIYKVRKAFAAEKGNKLIVADYGQLELRILAHVYVRTMSLHAHACRRSHTTRTHSSGCTRVCRIVCVIAF